MMTRKKKIWLGVLSFTPLAGMVLYLIIFLLTFVAGFFSMASLAHEAQNPSGGPPPGVLGGMGVAWFLMFLAATVLVLSIIVALGLMVYFAMHILNNPDLNQEKHEHILWLAVLFFGGGLGHIAYWYLKIWKVEDSPSLE